MVGIAGRKGRIKPPVTLGHEFCGVVESVGDEVSAVKPGDFVSAEMHLNCGHCHQCRLGQAHICQNLRIIGIDHGRCVRGIRENPRHNIWKLDPAIPEHYGAILDPLGNAVHTVLAGAIAGQTALVTGCGPIGLMSIAVAKACGSSAVFATETNEHRRELAKEMGANFVWNPVTEDPVKKILEATGGTGVDVLLEMSGHPAAIQQGFKALARWWPGIAARNSHGKCAARPGAGRHLSKAPRFKASMAGVCTRPGCK